MLKEIGMENNKKLLKDWEWLIYATFLTIISLKNFGKSKKTNEKSEEEIIKKLIAKCEEMGADCNFEEEFVYGIDNDVRRRNYSL
jgi:hypothetical protein